MTTLRVLVAVLLLVLLAGCAASSDQAGPPEVAAEVRALRLPFDSFAFSRLEIYAIQYAEDIYIGECMRRLGMSWEMLPPPPRQDPDPLNRRRYGPIEPEIAATYGYHEPPPTPHMNDREKVWANRERLRPAERNAAYGSDGQSGCSANARSRIRSDLPGLDESKLNDYSAESFQRSREDPTVVRAIQRWSACMEAAGFHYTHPFDAIEDPRWPGAGRPSAQEIAVAKADVRCKQQTRLAPVWNRAEARVQRHLVRSHPDDFKGFRQAKHDTLRAVGAILKGEGHA